MKKNLIIICLVILLTSCQRSSNESPTDVNSPHTPSPSFTPKPTKTKKPSPTPDPRTEYEDEYVFGFLGDDPYEPVWDESVMGFTYQEDDPREKVVIDENFNVPAGETFTFENVIVLVQPTKRDDIEVYGTLIIKDSLLIWLQTEYQQCRLRIKSGGILIIENSYSFWGNQYWVNWEYENGSTIKFDHFIGDPWTSIEGSVDYTAINYSTVKLTFSNHTHDTTMRISDSHHLWFEIFPPEGTHVISLPEKLQWSDWDLSDLWENTTIVVTDSYIYERDVSLSNNTHVTVVDTPSGFSMGWAIYKNEPGFVNCELRGLGEPGNEKGVYYEEMTWDLPCNNSSLTIKNSLLERAWPVTWGYIHLKVFDSFLVDIRNYGGPATMEVYDSTVDIAAAYQGGRIYLENSPVREAIEVKDAYSLIYGFGISDGYNILESDGGRFILLEEAGAPW
jgi:hypothetical protein